MTSNSPDPPGSVSASPHETNRQIPVSSYNAAELNMVVASPYEHPFMGYQQLQPAVHLSRPMSLHHSLVSDHRHAMSIHGQPPTGMNTPTHALDQTVLDMIVEALNEMNCLLEEFLGFQV
jgi:hypothetical protein